MDRQLVQRLTNSEIDHYLHEIDLALEMHIHWLNRINRSLVVHTPPAEADITAAPHELCNFGRWYRSVNNDELRNSPLFIAIDEVHRQVHEIARELLLRNRSRQPISSEQYERLITLSNAMRERVGELRHLLRNDQGITVRLMFKVFENAGEGVIITDRDTLILSINDAFSRVTGYSAQDVIGQRPSILRSGRQDDDFYRQMWQQLNTNGHWEGEIWNRRKNGDIYLEWLTISVVTDEDGHVTHYVGIFNDITRTKDNEQQLRYLAHYDQLTQLPNRILCQDRLRQAIAMAKREQHQVALMFIDLDGFKAVNDTLGHRAGDELLRQVARRLQRSLRESDTVSRFGGDEFTVILPEITSLDAVAQLAGKLVESVARPYDISGATARVTASVGISLYPDNSTSNEELLRQADSAMYHAKSHGKNHFEFFDPNHNSGE